jgi:hypothetical protein
MANLTLGICSEDVMTRRARSFVVLLAVMGLGLGVVTALFVSTLAAIDAVEHLA